MIDTFERLFVINLARRKDRYQDFVDGIPGDWPFGKLPERLEAIDGAKCRPPAWWKQGPGAWGCYRSHLALLEQAINEDWAGYLVFEDDATFVGGFANLAARFLAEVPDDWDQIYLGGQHLQANLHPPARINDCVYLARNVNRTHAFATRRKFFNPLYRFLTDTKTWPRGLHIDHRLGQMHATGKYRIYTPDRWLVGQRAGKSNISGRTVPMDRLWQTAGNIAAAHQTSFVAVLGTHSSGSSALAGILYHLGVHLGNVLGGYYGNDPKKSCGFEAVELARTCESFAPFPTTKIRNGSGLENRLRRWINSRKREAVARKTIAGGKYPTLCALAEPIIAATGDSLRLVAIDRPIAESIESLRRRAPDLDPDALAHCQTWLLERKEDFLNRWPADKIRRVGFGELLDDPTGTAGRLADFLELQPTAAQMARAVAYVDPKKRHIKCEMS